MLDRLLTYDAWANAEALASLRALPDPPAAAVRLLAHVAAAQLVWAARLAGEAAAVPVWPEWGLDEAAARLAEAAGRWRALRAGGGVGDPARVIAYATTRGERFESRAGDVLAHLALHGAHHRGQIAALVRAAGGTPAVTDFVHAARLGRVD